MGDKEEEVDVGKGELSDYNVGLTPVKGEWEEKGLARESSSL